MMLNVQSILLACFLGCVSAQNADCDFFQTLEPGQTYYIHSQRYPNYQLPNRTCHWLAVAPPGYRVRLVCAHIEIMKSTGCVQDRLLISRTGDPSLNDANIFCGVGSTTIESTGQRISASLITTAVSTGSRFLCAMEAFRKTAPLSTCQCAYEFENPIAIAADNVRRGYALVAGLIDRPTNSITCSGVIISPRYVLTSAQCLYLRNLTNTAVVVGEQNNEIDGTPPLTQVLGALSFSIHPLFTNSTYDNDIGILQTQSDIEFSEDVRQACLPFGRTDDSFSESIVALLGWATLQVSNSTRLISVDAEVVDLASCRGGRRRHICTYTRGKDTCQDTSGGPLLWTDPTTGRLYSIGIVSPGTLCASTKPALNTRTTEFLDWIQAQTGDTIYCKP